MVREQVHVSRTPDDVAVNVAGVLLERLAEAQTEGRVASWVLTGGSLARRVHRAVAAHADSGTVDWARVDFWWGDERYVASDHPDRNAGQAWEDMLQHLPVDPARVHAMPASDDGFASLEAAAWAHGEALSAWVAGRDPWFDVLMLGIGPDGHCASLFPGHPGVDADAHVVPVRDSPKPPPERISFGMDTLGRADQVLFAATGDDKATAVARSVAGGDVHQAPAAGPRGSSRTDWYVDEAAAAQVRR